MKLWCSVRLRARGFTLLEAIVAMTVVGVAMVPVFTFISQMSNGLYRAADANARNLAQQSIMEFLEPLNPLERPTGEDEIGDLVVRWESQELVPPNKEPVLGSGLIGYSIGFYKVVVSVDRPERGSWFSFDMRKTGYRRFPNVLIPGAPQ
jgi:prepilin-type N-terminal cleavage/methylation domain-containing protein